MKKYLINGAMALIVGGFIVSCSHDDISQPATVDQMTKSFDEMFTELYGPIAPNHNWGFETIAAEPGEEQLEAEDKEERAATRSAERAATRTPAEFGWEVSSDYDAEFNRNFYLAVLDLLPEEVDAKNEAENLCYQAEKFIKDSGDKISDEDKETIKSAVKDAKEVLENKADDKDALEAATKELNDKIMPIGAKLYQAAADDKKSDGDKSDSDKKDDDAVEGEVVDK